MPADVAVLKEPIEAIAPELTNQSPNLLAGHSISPCLKCLDYPVIYVP